MRYRTIGTTSLRVSEIGCGSWALGGLNWEEGRSSGWGGPLDDNEIIRTIHYALDKGVNHFDTADVYGNGTSERIIGKACLGKANDLVIASKIGYFKGCAQHAYTPAHIRSQCVQSLINLKRDHLDIYYFHNANFGPNDCYLADALRTMLDLQQEGKIRAIGLSAYATKDFARLIPLIKPSVVQSFAHCMDYHFIAPHSPLMQLCATYKCSFIAMSPLNQGILTGKYANTTPPHFPSGDHRTSSEKFLEKNLLRATQGIVKMQERFGTSVQNMVKASIGFVLAHEHVAGVIPGFRNQEQMTTNLQAEGFICNGEDVAFIRKAFANNK